MNYFFAFKDITERDSVFDPIYETLKDHEEFTKGIILAKWTDGDKQMIAVSIEDHIDGTFSVMTANAPKNNVHATKFLIMLNHKKSDIEITIPASAQIAISEDF